MSQSLPIVLALGHRFASLEIERATLNGVAQVVDANALDGDELAAVLQKAAVVMLGMVGYFTGVVQTPITALIIVMEMTDNSTMLLPLMATALIAKGVSRIVCPHPLYQSMATAYINAISNPEPPSGSKSG